MMRRSLLAVLMSCAVASLAVAETRIHHAPTENLERIDVDLLARAERSIDFAGFIVTDRAVIDALIAAAARGVTVRLLLDHTQTHDLVRLRPLLDRARRKPGGPIMHMKAYLVDGRVLRTGSANFKANSLQKQNNDLITTDDVDMAAAFAREFERIWSGGEPIGTTPP